MLKNKVLHLNSAFTIKQDALPQTGNTTIESIFIEGYASTIDIDRQGDVVPKSVWEAGIQNYLKNPIILAQHDYDDPIGRMVDYKIDDKGLWVKARISSAAEECYGLIKDKVLTAFSIGFKVLDAEYNSAAEVFLIKELELVEISVVSVPCNQNTVFDLSKAFSDANEYTEFKQQFAISDNSAKGLEVSETANGTSKGKWKMDPKELEQMVAMAAKSAAEQATKSLVAAQEAAALEKAASEKAAQEFDAKVKAAVAAQVTVGESGAERLLAEMTKRIDEQTNASKSALEGLEASIKEKAAELAAIQRSKMSFNDKQTGEAVSYQDREKAVMLAKIAGKSIENTKFGQELLAKAATYTVNTPGVNFTGSTNGQIATGSAHQASGIWELEVSTNMESEVRRRLVVAPLIRAINMNTNVMTMPLNPEAGLATWVNNSSFGAAPDRATTAGNNLGASAGGNATHKLKEITLNAYKLATNEYLAYEEEEDSILVVLPIVRDAMIRRIARSVDRAYLRGTGTTNDPVTGLAGFATGTNVTAPKANAASIANLRTMRKNLVAWGLDPAEVVYVVSTEIYYDLLDDNTFQTMNQVGPQATLLTGQIGQIGGSPVLVSAEFDAKPTTGTTTTLGAVCFAPGNFLAGNQRGLRMDTQELVETQRRVLVASLRTGMTQVTSNLGSGVTSFSWTNA